MRALSSLIVASILSVSVSSSAAPPAPTNRARPGKTTAKTPATAPVEETPAPAPPVVEPVATTTTTTTAAANENERRRPIRIAVYSLEAGAVSPQVVRVVEDSLLGELRKLRGASVISLDEVKALLELEADRQVLGCSEGEGSCLAEIAEALGADALIVGSVSTFSGQSVLSLKRISPEAAEVVHAFNQPLKAADGEELLAAIGPATAALFPELELKPGQTRGVPEAMALRLHPPPLSPIVFGIGAGVTVLGGVASGVTAWWWQRSQGELQTMFDDAKSDAISGRSVVDKQAEVTLAHAAFWGSVGATAAFALATAATIPFTDWDDAAGASE